MRVALLHPTYWPEVRRGSERMVHDLGTQLASRGHEVTLLTGHPSRTTVTVEDGMRVVRRRRLPEGLPLTRAYDHHLVAVPNLIRDLLRGYYDVAHALFPVDAWAAAQARRLGGPPYVFSFNGIPTRRYLVERRYRLEMLRTSIRGAARVTVLSEAAAKRFRRYLFHEPTVLPPGVVVEDFAIRSSRADVPTLVCASSLGDPRKRGELLLSAFRELRGDRPDARLLVARSRDAVMSVREPSLCDGAEWIEADRTEDLARAYASAWSTVLPAVDEAFGLVLIESLAAGTPVVAARSGGCPEIANGERVGTLFEPDDRSDLVHALERSMSLSQNAETEQACRSRAAEYDWGRLVERYEALYEDARGSG